MERLSEKEWGEFYIGDLFSVSRPKVRNKDDYAYGDVPFVASGAANNGVMKCCKGKENEVLDAGNCLTVSPVDGSTFYQPMDFLGRGGAGSSILMLRSDSIQSDFGQFIARAVQQTCSKYSYGHMGNKDGIKRERVMLPVDNKGKPDYAYMTLYSTEVKWGMLMRYKNFIAGRLSQLEHKDILALGEKEWGEFVLGDIFTVDAGKRLETRNKVEGNRPFIGATDNGNGVTGFVGNDNTSKDSNVLGVNYNGAPCIAFYHPYECIFTDDVKRLHLKNQEDNKFVLLFFTSIFAMQRVKYSYGYKFKEKRMHRQKLMLPVTDGGKPDYEYMEQYAKNMMLRKYEQYLAFIDRQSSAEEVNV